MARRDVVGGMRASCILNSVATRSLASVLQPLASFRRRIAGGADKQLQQPLPMEPLEDRRLLASVNLANGILSLSGNNGQRNTMTVTRSGTSNYVAKVGSLSK